MANFDSHVCDQDIGMFLDFTNLPPDDVKHLRNLLKPKQTSQRKVRFPWDFSLLQRNDVKADSSRDCSVCSTHVLTSAQDDSVNERFIQTSVPYVANQQVLRYGNNNLPLLIAQDHMIPVTQNIHLKNTAPEQSSVQNLCNAHKCQAVSLQQGLSVASEVTRVPMLPLIGLPVPNIYGSVPPGFAPVSGFVRLPPGSMSVSVVPSVVNRPPCGEPCFVPFVNNVSPAKLVPDMPVVPHNNNNHVEPNVAHHAEPVQDEEVSLRNSEPVKHEEVSLHNSEPIHHEEVSLHDSESSMKDLNCAKVNASNLVVLPDAQSSNVAVDVEEPIIDDNDCDNINDTAFSDSPDNISDLERESKITETNKNDDAIVDSDINVNKCTETAKTESKLAELPAPSSAPIHSSWASLFRNTATAVNATVVKVPTKEEQLEEAVKASLVGDTNKVAEKQENHMQTPTKTVVECFEDSHAKELGEILSRLKPNHRTVALHPRGLINKGNWCYIHATLQAFLACPPFYHLMKAIPFVEASSRGPSSTPIIDTFTEFVNEFKIMSLKPGPKSKRQPDLSPGPPFEPAYVYEMLGLIKSELSHKGRQEDAEEFLGCVLNGLHEEMLAAMKITGKSVEEAKLTNGDVAIPIQGIVVEGCDMVPSDTVDEWERVGPKNKSSITRSAELANTPISQIFGGQMRSELQQEGARGSANLQPFFTLQLDIQSDKVSTLQDAMEGLVSKEAIHGYTCSKTKTEVAASRRLSIEHLPPVLIMHLKCFTYDMSGGCQKILKRIDYPVDLEVGKDLLSAAFKSKHASQRKYKLFAIVSHHGRNAAGGHWTADVFHMGINGWIRADDSLVKPLPLAQVLKYTPPKQPYLLFYRRCDLM